MAKEKGETTTPAVERLKDLFFRETREMTDQNIWPLNTSEKIIARYYSSGERTAMHFFVEKEGRTLLDFLIDQSGLIYLNAGELEMSFGDSEGVKLGKNFGEFGDRGSFTSYKIGEREKFEGLADNIADWVEKVVHDGSIGEIPFKIIPSLK